MAACLASMLEISIDEVTFDSAKEDWLEQTQAFLKPFGLYYLEIRLAVAVNYPTYELNGVDCIFFGHSPRGKWNHVVIGRIGHDQTQNVASFSMIHDPHPSNDGLVGIPTGIGFLVQLNPALQNRSNPEMKAIVGAVEAGLKNEFSQDGLSSGDVIEDFECFIEHHKKVEKQRNNAAAACRRALEVLKRVRDHDRLSLLEVQDAEPGYQPDARCQAIMEEVNEEIELLKSEIEQPHGVIIYKSEKHHVSADGVHITARALAEWIATLPEEFQKSEFMANAGPLPSGLKRVVAFRHKGDPKEIGVVANPMGTHLPMDDSLTWEKVLTAP